MYRVLVLAALFVAGHAVPQAVTSVIAPSGTAPRGCVPTYNGKFAVGMEFSNGTVTPRDIAAPIHIISTEPEIHVADEAMNLNGAEPTGFVGGQGLPSCVTPTPGDLVLTLNDGIILDEQGRTAYIASNFQFQFDNPPQAGALTTAGYSACQNGSLALGSSAVFWQCASGSFYNIYDRWWAEQCLPSLMIAIPLCS